MDKQQSLKKIRLDILQMVFNAKEGHIPSAFSIVEILFVIYDNMSESDRFFLSKGHASAGLYAVLAHFGYLSQDDLATFCRYDSKLGGHPHRLKINNVMNSSGSLGHGFPAAAGYALSKKILKESGRVFCIIGDGESNEGTIWETAMYAEQLKLNNLVCIVDNNKSQTRAMTSVNLKEKFEAFGWDTYEIDGHNIVKLEKVLFINNSGPRKKPLCIVANTVKGKGIKELEENYFAWHHKAPTEEELEKFKKELL